LKVSFRPIRRVKAAWPKMPSETAAIAGGKTTAAPCAIPCEIATGQ
jgi:hypothetical protein